jgi:hypothetical protein
VLTLLNHYRGARNFLTKVEERRWPLMGGELEDGMDVREAVLSAMEITETRGHWVKFVTSMGFSAKPHDCGQIVEEPIHTR